jgi:hypothetical protein
MLLQPYFENMNKYGKDGGFIVGSKLNNAMKNNILLSVSSAQSTD